LSANYYIYLFKNVPVSKAQSFLKKSSTLEFVDSYLTNNGCGCSELTQADYKPKGLIADAI